MDLSALRAGSEYCLYTNLTKSVVLVKVVSLATGKPTSIQLSATAWKAPKGQLRGAVCSC